MVALRKEDTPRRTHLVLHKSPDYVVNISTEHEDDDLDQPILASNTPRADTVRTFITKHQESTTDVLHRKLVGNKAVEKILSGAAILDQFDDNNKGLFEFQNGKLKRSKGKIIKGQAASLQKRENFLTKHRTEEWLVVNEASYAFLLFALVVGYALLGKV